MDYDEILVESIVNGERVRGTIRPADRREVTRRMALREFTDGQIAERLGCTRRTVLRNRQILNVPASLPLGGNQQTRTHDAPNRPIKAG